MTMIHLIDNDSFNWNLKFKFQAYFVTINCNVGVDDDKITCSAQKQPWSQWHWKQNKSVSLIKTQP